MKLAKRVILDYQAGNSDKVDEVDLCDKSPKAKKLTVSTQHYYKKRFPQFVEISSILRL